jgi:hypothetical protein
MSILHGDRTPRLDMLKACVEQEFFPRIPPPIYGGAAHTGRVGYFMGVHGLKSFLPK